jgi:cytochrome d ubiquinol oxidase subunit II
LVAAFAQGVIIGAVMQGVPLGPGHRFNGGSWDFLSGYTVLTGLTTVVLFTLAGATLIEMRSHDIALKSLTARAGRILVVAAAGLIALSGALIPVAGASSLRLDQPLRVALMVGLCVIAATMLFGAWWSFGHENHDYMAFVVLAVAEVAGAAGLIVLSYPMIVPSSLTIAQAASPSSSLEFLLGGMSLLVPIAAAYNAWAFWALRPRRNSVPSFQ